jgi:hypothetical protein
MESLVVPCSFAAFRSKICSPALQAIADHWNAVREPGKMPAWSDIRPAAIAPHLTRIWSFKYDRTTGDFTARLAGNQVTLGFGMSFRGTPLRDMYAAPSFEEAQARLTRLVCTPAFYRSSGKLFRVNGHVGEGERIILPLACDGKTGDGAFGASDYPPLPPGAMAGPVEVIHEMEEWFSVA